MSYDTTRRERWKIHRQPMGMSRSAVVPWSDLSQRTTRVTLVPTKHSAKSVFIWDDHFRKYDWGVSGIMSDEVSISRNEWTTRRTVASAKYHGHLRNN